MKNFYRRLSKIMLVFLVTSIPFATTAQEAPTEPTVPANTAQCYKYWSVGAFGGLTQFNGDLSKNLWGNLYSKSVGYNIGLVATKQFSRVIGVRVRFAYANIHSGVQDKWVWDYQDGNGVAEKVTHSFRSSIFETDLQLTVNWLNWILGHKPERIFSSYLIGGIGMDHSSGTMKDINGIALAYLGRNSEALNVGNTSGIGGDNLQFKAEAGLGFDFNLSKHFSVPVEFIWRWQNSDLLDMTRGGAKSMVNDMYSSGTVGITYKFGYSCPKQPEKLAAMTLTAVVAPIPEPNIRFSVIAPRNIPAERNVREIFPIRNYVFFDLGSKEIPARYVHLSKNQVKEFKEEQVAMYVPENLSGRSYRQMTVYYNVLNILGDRLGKIPEADVHLTGSSMEGPDEGKAMAESVKRYLVSIWGIEATRIITEGRVKPDILSEQPGGTKELDLLREEDRRVSIWSATPALLMEFQNGENAPLKPVEILALQKAPIESYVRFNNYGANLALTSWSFVIRDDQGTLQHFGPYRQETVVIPGKTILGTRPEGKYKVTMTGLAKNGSTVRKDTTVNMVLWTPPTNQEVLRFSILYEFNESKAIVFYEKYLTEIVAPKIPEGGKVIIHGYTDIIGDSTYNQTLSLERANDVRNILINGLSTAGNKDVQFEVYGFGEDQKLSPFENQYPEERFYNRMVIIDLIPLK
ncbi:MAG: OmpA family protein [Bacteroidales bacterium]|nr:OmpA family protein [Bacteroidales bacterium]